MSTSLAWKLARSDEKVGCIYVWYVHTVAIEVGGQFFN